MAPFKALILAFYVVYGITETHERQGSPVTPKISTANFNCAFVGNTCFFFIEPIPEGARGFANVTVAEF